jgi:hypothetical protein
LPKRKKSFQNAKLITETLIFGVESLSDGFLKKQEIMSAINDLPFSASMVKRRVQYIYTDFQRPLSSDVGQTQLNWQLRLKLLYKNTWPKR